MVLSAELSAAVLFVAACFDCSELRVKESDESDVMATAAADTID